MAMRARQRGFSPVIIVVVIVAVIGLAWGGVAIYSALNTKSTVNYAEEIAKPLEAALVANGATRACTKGSAGRGPDNTQPWYQSYFAIPEPETRAVSLISGIATDNGFSLDHASPTHRGPLGVDDKFIDKWYFDNTSKASPYQDLKAGPVRLYVQVNANGLSTTCSSDITIDEGHSAVGIEVRMPELKR